MINRKTVVAALAIGAALAASPAFAEENSPKETIRVFNASPERVRIACDANGGDFYMDTDSSGELGYGCATESGAFVDCNEDYECYGDNPNQQRTVRQVRRLPGDRPSAALPRPRQ